MRLLWLALVLAAAQAPVSSPTSAVPAGVPGDAVRIDAIVSDANGRPVETLTAADFVLREDGAVQSIQEVRLVKVNPTIGSADGVPPITSAAVEKAEAVRANTRVVGVYLDEYFVSRANAERVRAALHRLVDEDLGPRDLMTIVRPLDSLLTIRLTRDRAALHKTIDAFEGRRGDYEPRTAFERSYIVGERGRADEQRAQTTWSTLNALTLHLANLRAGRTAILLASEQADPVVRRRGLEALPTSSSVMRTANRSNVSIYVLDPRGDAERAADPNEGPNLLRVVADDTDGAVLMTQADLDAGLKRMVADASSYYLLTYRSLRNRDGMFHAVDVAVKKPGVRVRARKGYWAPTPDEVERANLLAHANDPRPARPFLPARHLSPLIRPWFGMARGVDGKTRVTFVWEPSAVTPGDRRVKVASRVELKALGSDGTAFFDAVVKPSGPLPIEAGESSGARAVFDVPPGRVELRMSVEDSAAQTIDSDVRDILVRDLRGAVVLGTPEVLRARTARDLRELRADAGAAPVASREFSRTEHLVIRVPAYAPGGRPHVSAALVSPAGQEMRTLDAEAPAASDGKVQIDVPLAGLAPGVYSIKIAAAGAGGEAKETVAFRVTN